MSMTDEELADERQAQDQVRAVIASLRTEPNMPRIEAATLLRRAAILSYVRMKHINEFGAALLDDERGVDEILQDEAPDFDNWDEALAMARRAA